MLPWTPNPSPTMDPTFPGRQLALHLEAADASNAAACATEHIEAGGGVVAFAGPDSPLTHAVGVGMNGPVTESDLDRIETFFFDRGAASNIDLCPLADPSLPERLGRRGYRITEFNNVLYLALGPSLAPSSDVRVALPHERDLWSRTMVAGFFERDNLSDDELRIGEAIFDMPGAIPCIAEVGGAAAAAATARAHEGVVSLFGDSTLPRFRGRGLHQRLIQSRLARAAGSGCTLAFAATLPGSISQRNYFRAGFLVAYTKMNMSRAN